jgi:hypothetical protein
MKLSVILHACAALVAELVDATDSKSVAFTGVPVRVWPRAPFTNLETINPVFHDFCEKKSLYPQKLPIFLQKSKI